MGNSRRSGSSYPEALVELRPSKMLKGQIGVFALRNMKKGTIVGSNKYLADNILYTWKRYKTIDKATRNVIDKFCLGDEKGFYSPFDINYISIPYYFNHSCSGQIGFDSHSNFVTRIDVRSGEELSYDYGLAEANPSFSMKCKCGSPNCRKVVTGNDWANPEFRKNNLKYMLPELRDRKK